MKELINIGKISGTHNLKGNVKVLSVFENMEILEGKKIILKYKNGDKKLFTIEEALRLNDKRIVLKFEEISNINEAKALLDGEVYIKRDIVMEGQDEDEYFLSDILDMEVIDINKGKIGIVKDVFSTAAHDIYVVNEGKEEIMIPAVDEFIKEIDFNKGVIKVELIEGMIKEPVTEEKE